MILKTESNGFTGLRKLCGLIFTIAAVSWAFSVQAQEAAAESKAPKPDKLFSTRETLEVTLHAPWRDIVKNEDVKTPYPATIEFTDSMGQTQSIELTVERRGLTRQRVCQFPPIKLRFDKEKVKGTTFRGQKSIKMVTHCDKGDRWEQYYIKEMLAYYMYNLFTERSFKARPLSITYVDSKKGKKQDPRFAFLIEDDSDVAKRNELEKLKILEIDPDQLEPIDASRFALFQYLIGNVDWSALSGPDPKKCCHNAKLMGLDPNVNVYAVPYDFDSSGLVDAHYAAPNESLPINSVTQRLYRGFCEHNSTLESAKQEFLDNEQAIFDLVSSEGRLSTRSQKNMNKYVAKFYGVLKDQKKWNKFIIGKCRK